MSPAAALDEVGRAVEELEEAFPGRVDVVSRDQTGAIVRVREVELSARWTPRRGDLWFLVPFHYPDAPIYPCYVVGARPTGGLVQALQVVSWQGMEVIQVSLRHSSWDPSTDNAVGYAIGAISWLRTT